MGGLAITAGKSSGRVVSRRTELGFCSGQDLNDASNEATELPSPISHLLEYLILASAPWHSSTDTIDMYKSRRGTTLLQSTRHKEPDSQFRNATSEAPYSVNG